MIKQKNKSNNNFGKKVIGKFSSYITNKDDYGSGIQFNYKGSSKFKTFPGGILSMIMTLFLYSYGFM